MTTMLVIVNTRIGEGIYGWLCNDCFRLYTGIHALKPKFKPEIGVKSESTTARNVDQKDTVCSSRALLPPTPLTVQDQNVVVISATEPFVRAAAIQRKEGVLAVKANVEKKRIDARKKSLRRL